eukprot:TRINITY_DN3265_c0_g1_i5.p1 TRINITY_DN3265_c0_g1~~TRINITY_DN3265_c0_g1_i5.p1  ORF type:complete len:165 (+),score=41.06 TRINITY_DN3265_c0_g1_i5:82-576(+)
MLRRCLCRLEYKWRFDIGEYPTAGPIQGDNAFPGLQEGVQNRRAGLILMTDKKYRSTFEINEVRHIRFAPYGLLMKHWHFQKHGHQAREVQPRLMTKSELARWTEIREERDQELLARQTCPIGAWYYENEWRSKFQRAYTKGHLLENPDAVSAATGGKIEAPKK